MTPAAPGAAQAPLGARSCPLCGGPNHCAPAACGRFDVDCWCAQASVDPAALARVQEAARGKACLCPRCAAGHPADSCG